VSVRQHSSAYVSVRQHSSAYVSVRQYTSSYVNIIQRQVPTPAANTLTHHRSYIYMYVYKYICM
jgi:hypothetical protein